MDCASLFFSFSSSSLQLVPATVLRTLGPAGPLRAFLLVPVKPELPSRPMGCALVLRRLERIRECVQLRERSQGLEDKTN